MGEASAIAIALLVSVTPGPGADPQASPREPPRQRLERAERRPSLPHALRLPIRDVDLPAGARHRLRQLESLGFEVEIDPLTGRPGRAIGGGIPWLPGSGNDLAGERSRGAERRQVLFERALAFVAAEQELFRLPDDALGQDQPGTVCVEAHELDVVRLQLLDGQVPVLGGGLVFVVRHGNLVYFGSSHAQAPGETESGTGAAASRAAAAALSESVALDRMLEAAGLTREEWIPLAPRRSLFVLPYVEQDQPRRRLIRALRGHLRGDWEEWEGWVDGRSGALVAFFPAELSSCPAAPSVAPARVRGGVRPARGDDPEEVRTLPYADLGSGAHADGSGRYVHDGRPRSSELKGRFAAVTCINCQNPAVTRAESDEGGSIDFGIGPAGGPDNRGNGTSTLAARTAYRHVQTVHDLAAKWLGASLGFLDRSIDLHVNTQNSCNAAWSGVALRFFLSSGECRNTGEIRDVVAHEWGHALDDFDGTGISDYALSEGAADVLAMLLDRDACIAESMYVDPLAPGASAECRGVRHLDERATALDHVPAVLTVNANDCQGGSHCLGEIYGQAAWHLRFNLETGTGYADSSFLGAALGEDRAWETMERLYMLSRPLAETLDPRGAGLSIYDAYLLADRDPDGNLPHAAHIHEAFRHHGLVESLEAPFGRDCRPPQAPVLSGVRIQLGEGGEPEATLRWLDTDAARYRLLRRRLGDALAFEPVGPPLTDTDAVEYALADSGLDNAASYEYLVLAEGVAACWSEASARATVAARFAEIEVAAHAESDPRPGGDGDGIPEKGEFIEVRVELAETSGLSEARDVTAELVSLDPWATVAGSPVADYGTIPAAGRSAAAAPFVLYLDPRHACQGAIPLLLRVNDQDGCRVRALEVPLPAAGCPSGDRSDVHFVSARVADDGLRPGCTDADQVLDAHEEALLLVTVENRGSAAASAVDVILSTPESRISFVSGSRSRLDLALAAGERTEVPFKVLAGDLGCRQEVSFQVEVHAPENLSPGTGSFALETEADLGAATVHWGFESGLEGWSTEGLWQLSRARSNPDDAGQSLWSGAAPNLCAAAASPPVQLHPLTPATLTVATWYQLEGRFQAKYWDGANLYLQRETGPVLLEPAAGRPYDASLGRLVLCEPDRPAWCADQSGLSWAESVFDLAPFAGETVRIELRHGTDNKETAEGFYLDDVAVTQALAPVCDRTLCPADPSCSAPEMSIAATGSGCAGLPVTLIPDFDYFGQGAFRYLWEFGDGAAAVAEVADAPVAHAYGAAGSYVARLTATSVADPRCSSSATLVLLLDAQPLADAGPDGQAPITVGTPGFPQNEYAWEPAAGLSAPSAAQPQAEPAESTYYCLTVHNRATACEARDCVLVRVPGRCGLAPDAVRGLMQVRRGGDVEASWPVEPLAASYDFYRLTAKDEIPAAEARNGPAALIVSGPATSASDLGAAEPPPAAPRLLFYQVVPRCP